MRRRTLVEARTKSPQGKKAPVISRLTSSACEAHAKSLPCIAHPWVTFIASGSQWTTVPFS